MAISHEFQYNELSFSLSKKYFIFFLLISSLTRGSKVCHFISKYLRSLQRSFLLFLPNSVLFWSENILCDLSCFNSLRFILWPQIWPLLAKTPHALAKSACSAAVGWGFLLVSTRSVGCWWCSSLLYALIFLSSCSISYWEKRIDISDHNCRFVYFPYSFKIFFLPLFSG